jgi:hypothetical protein
MAYTRTYTIDASPSGDTVKAAIATKLDGDLTDIYTNLTSHEAMTTNAHGVGSGTIVGTATTDTLTNKTLSSPTLTGTLSGGTISGVTMTATITASGATIVSPTITGGSAVNMTIETPTLTGTLTLTSPTLTGTIDASGATISSPTITGATLSNPTLTGTITGITSGGNNFMEFTNLNIAASVGSKALTVALKGVDGNDPAAGNKVIIPFRSATLTSGIIKSVEVTSALSVVLSSGSTLGFTAAEAGRIYTWAINNAGTVELALSRTAGMFDEAALVTTVAEGGGGAADSATAMYSTTQRTSLPCRCIGFIDITTGATAGEWDNAPTKIHVGTPKTQYAVTTNLATTITSGGALDQAAITTTVAQSGRYAISCHLYVQTNASATIMSMFIKTGSSTYSSAVQKAYSYGDSSYNPTGFQVSLSIDPTIVWLNAGESIHLGVLAPEPAGTVKVFGDSDIVGATQLTFIRIE